MSIGCSAVIAPRYSQRDETLHRPLVDVTSKGEDGPRLERLVGLHELWNRMGRG
jgi:hypothetical protein